MSVLDNPGKIVGVTALGSLVGLLIFGGLGFFITPHYKELVDTVVSAFKDVFIFTGGVKAGLSVPKTDPLPVPEPKEEPEQK